MNGNEATSGEQTKKEETIRGSANREAAYLRSQRLQPHSFNAVRRISGFLLDGAGTGASIFHNNVMFNETSYSGLSDLGSYVHGGARIMYQATTAPFDPVGLPWESPGQDRCNKLRSIVGANLGVSSFGCDAKNGSINLQATVPGDFSDENDVKALIDGAVGQAGFTYRQSMLRMISNPGGSSSNPFVPGAAGAEPAPSKGGSILDVAAEFWGKVAGDVAEGILPTTSLGMGMSIGTIALIAVGAYLLLRR